jgi:hypothetical protein
MGFMTTQAILISPAKRTATLMTDRAKWRKAELTQATCEDNKMIWGVKFAEEL